VRVGSFWIGNVIQLALGPQETSQFLRATNMAGYREFIDGPAPIFGAERRLHERDCLPAPRGKPRFAFHLTGRFDSINSLYS
jgi:hypothetical protein